MEDEDGQRRSFPVNRHNYFTGHVIGKVFSRVSESDSPQSFKKCWVYESPWKSFDGSDVPENQAKNLENEALDECLIDFDNE